MYEIKFLNDVATARGVGQFLVSSNAFEQEWAPDEKAFVLQAPIDSVTGHNHYYWYVEDNNEIVAAMGVRENKYGSGGYVMDEDYFAVHKLYRKKGLASMLLAEMEKVVKEKGGRYIHVLTCDIPYYAPARAFYERNGYSKVAELPDYYVEGEGRVDYFKKMR